MKPPESEPFWNLYVLMNPKHIEFKFILQETSTIFLACLLGPILNTGINALVLDRMFGKSSSLDSLFTVYIIIIISFPFYFSLSSFYFSSRSNYCFLLYLFYLIESKLWQFLLWFIRRFSIQYCNISNRFSSCMWWFL